METPQENPILNFDQLRAVDTAQKRLANLQNEVSIAKTDLAGIRAQCESATKERLYQEELSKDLSSKNSASVLKLDTLNGEITEKTAELTHLLDTIKEHIVTHETKENELKDREGALVVKETEHTKNAELHGRKETDLNIRTEAFSAKVAKLKEVIKDF